MELRQLRYFAAVAELNSFTRAAERCLVSQPALSQQIMKLEECLGVELLDRSGRTVQLTDAGQIFYARAVEILSAVDDAERRVRGLRDEAHFVRIGLIPTIAPFVLPRLLPAVKAHAGEVRVRIHEDVTDKLLDAITAGGLDFAVIALPWRNAARTHTTPLWREPLLMMMPAKHPLTAEDAIAPDAIRDLPYVALSDVHCLSEHIDVYCEQHRFEPDIVSRATQLLTLRHMVAAGLGVAMVPEMAVASLDDPAVVIRPLSGDPPQREIAVAWRANRRMTPTLDAVLTILRDHLPLTAAPKTASGG